MRKQWSVFEGLLRSKMKGMLLTVLLEVVLGIGGYWLFFGFQKDYLALFSSGSDVSWTGEFFSVWAFIGLILCVLSCVEISQKKSNRSNLYRRLLISERMEFFWDTVCNILLFLFLWAVEIGILYSITSMIADHAAYNRNWSYAAMSIYIGRCQYAILPMENTLLWIRQTVYILIAAIGCSCLTVAIREESASLRFATAVCIGAYGISLMNPYFAHETVREVVLMVGTVAVACYAVIRTIRVTYDGKDCNTDEK